MKNLAIKILSENSRSTNVLRDNAWIQVSLSMIILLSFAALAYSFSIHDIIRVENLSQGAHYVLAAVMISFFVMLLCALTPLPAEAITLMNGLLFGPAIGALITWLSAMLGAYLAFSWGLYCVNRLNIDIHSHEKFGRVRQWVQRWGLMGFLMARLIPVVPFFALNFGAAVLQISRRNYLIITGLAILPHILIICYMAEYVD